MHITVRIPTEQYAFQEVEFDSIAEYKEQMPAFIKAYKELKVELKSPPVEMVDGGDESNYSEHYNDIKR